MARKEEISKSIVILENRFLGNGCAGLLARNRRRTERVLYRQTEADQLPNIKYQPSRSRKEVCSVTLLPDTNWGFVIVRAVYGPSSDVVRAQMLELLRDTVSEELTEADQLELLSRHEITIIEDEATLAGADSFAARRAFLA
jgi:hypothetical protein